MTSRLLLTAATALLLASPAHAQATTDSGSAPAATTSGADTGTAPAATTSGGDSGTAPATTTSSADSASGDQSAQSQHAILSSGSGEAAATQTMSAGSADVGKSASTPATPANQNGHVGGAAAEAPHVSTESELTFHDWPFQGVFGTYDRTAIQRGFSGLQASLFRLPLAESVVVSQS